MKSAIIGRMIRRRKWFLKIAITVVALVVLLAAGLFLFPQWFLCMDSGPVKANVIILLGGSAHERCEYAAQLFLQAEAPRILVSGAGDEGINRRFLVRDGIPAHVIAIEDKSKTTCENARYCAPILRAEKVRTAIIVTSWYHSRRALKTFEHFAPDIKFYSRPSYFNYKHTRWSRDFSRRVYWEYVKLPGYWVAYGVWPF
ncbi:MAG TPA: YdcF family protein [Verrucomicrobiae bacterium]|nr:YdcF family protein [Verrucomicrobiae bacterium]